MSDSLETATIPAQIDAADGEKWAAAFEEYFQNRKTNTDAIADLALENFEEVCHLNAVGIY